MKDSVILVTDRYAPEALQRLRSTLGEAHEIIVTDLRPEKSLLARATAMLIRSRTVIDASVLKHMPDLRVVVTATNGFDHIDLVATRERNVAVMYTPDANTESAAEHTLLLMLGALRRLNESGRALRDGRWKDDIPTGHEIRGKTVGLIGLGRVGSRVAELLQAFGAHVIAYDPYQKDEVFDRLRIDRMGLTEVFAQSEILSLHVPLTAETRRMIRAETLELTHEGLVLINTSRGRVIDESALVAALESKQLSAVGLDVFEHEPLARDSRLRKMPNVLLSPHIGAYTEEAFLRASTDAVYKLIEFLQSGQARDQLLP